jgi:hypothetical protein
VGDAACRAGDVLVLVATGGNAFDAVIQALTYQHPSPRRPAC